MSNKRNKKEIIKKILNNKNNGFTLVELIVVMAVVAVIVLLAVPRFLGRTKEATKTKHLSNVRQVEEASERYYLDEQDWPRLSDEAYTHTEIHSFADNIYDITGEKIQLDVDGNYYDIDYEALTKYVKVPSNADKNNYILQNPVGKVFYMEGLTDKGQERINYSGKLKEGGGELVSVKEYKEWKPSNGGLFGLKEGKGKLISTKRYDKTLPKNTNPSEVSKGSGKLINTKNYDDDKSDISFRGLGAAAFDGNNSTSVPISVGRTVTWDGDLTHRTIRIRAKGYYYGSNSSRNRTLYVSFRDNNGRTIPSLTNTINTVVGSDSSIRTTDIVVPEGATSMYFNNDSSTGSTTTIYEISVIKE